MLAGAMTEAVRTPEEALEGLPGFPFAAHYRDVDGLRLAHIDEGELAGGFDPIVFHRDAKRNGSGCRLPQGQRR